MVYAMKKILITLAAIAMSATFALTGAGTASADPGLCWNGWIWSACIQGPGWVDWNPGWNGNWGDNGNHNGWDKHGHGGWDD
jgi:hypothetical protein